METTTNVQPSTGQKRTAVIGISFAAGLTLGVVAVIAIQNFGPLNDQTTYDIAQSEVQQYSKQNGRSDAITSTSDFGKIQEIFKLHRISEQLEALHTTLSRSTEQELQVWWNQAQNIERASHRKIAQDVILRKLTAMNPKDALRYLDDVSIFQTDALLRTVFSEWAVVHLDGAIETASTLVASRRNVALEAILETRDDLSENERRTIAMQLKREEIYQKLISDAKALKSIAKPQESWDLLLSDNVDDSLQTGTLAMVAEAWQEQIGFEVLSKIYSAEIENYWVSVQLVEAIAKVDPAGALKYAQELSKEYERSDLSNIIVRGWARTDALAALAAVSTMDPSSNTPDLEKVFARAWARANPYELIENIEAVSEDFRVSPLEIAFSYVARQDPLEAIDMLSSVENFVGNTSTILNRIVDQWAMGQPEAATTWILNNFAQEDPQRRPLLQEVLPSLARQEPNRAFELAMEQPAPEERYGLEFYVFRQITRDGDIELAKRLLPRVRENSKAFAYSDIAQAMVNDGQTIEALELGSDLEPLQQRSYYQVVMQNWVTTDPLNLYESVESLPSSTTKSLAADKLISRNQYDPIFTDDQIEQLRTLLSSDDRARLERFEK